MKPSAPHAPEEPLKQHAAATDFLSRPEFDPPMEVQRKPRALLILVTLLTLFLIAGAGFWGYRYYIDHHTKATAANRSAQAILTDPYAGWKTYKSDAEQATFRYPTNWTVTSPSSSGGLVDSTAIKSPSGAITVTWISTITPGFGNEHSASYPAHTVIDKTPITGAPGLYVVSGITTLDGAAYYPWIAVQDSRGILTSQVNGDLLLFTGRHNYGPSLAGPPYVLFSTSGIRAHENSPALTKAQATAWFSGAEAKQAKLILLSFSDPQKQYLTIKEWGVRLMLDSTTASMYYYIKPDLPNVAYVSLRAVAAVAPDCAADKIALGAISRLTEAQQQAATANPSALNEPGTIHIGRYWYNAQNSHAACIDISTDAAVQKALPGYNIGEIAKALNTLAADPTAN